MTDARIDRRRFALLAGGAAAAGIIGTAPKAAAAEGPHGDGHVPDVVQRWADAWNTGDAELMASLFTEDGVYTDHAFQASFTGRAAVAQWVVITLDSITDARLTILDAFRRGDRAAARWTFEGVFNTIAPFEPGDSGVDPRGKPFSVPAVSYFRLTRSGRAIRAVEDVYNLAELMRQLGLPVPYTPPQA